MRLAAVAALASGCAAAPAVAADQTRHSLAGGCFTLTAPSGQPVPGAEKVRMQATGLAGYLLYRGDGTFLAAQADGSTAPAGEPSPAADWRVREASGGAFTLSPASAEEQALGGDGRLAEPGPATQLRFAPAEGCAAYPEAELNATGRPAKGEAPYVRVGGLVEGHMHWMTYEYFGKAFHCGRPWHAYGIPYALPDCSEIEGPQGIAAPFQNFLNFGNPAAPHDTQGWPTLAAWGPNNLTYEGTYWRWIERAWLGGLRLIVMGVNENRILCELQARKYTNCNEMDTVRRGFRAIRELQDYVDAQAGGPGKGFFQIVTDPFQARRVINEGRMAVVLEIEISEPFDCVNWHTPTCDKAQIDRQLEEMHAMGVRSSLLLNKFDNPLTGVRFDGGPVGVLINAGNRASAGSFFSARTCTGPLADNTIETFVPEGSAFLDSVLGGLGVERGTLPAYPPAPHCNTRGLTELGRHVVRRMMDLGMIVNPDHMSQAAVDDTLTLLESRGYSGAISPHGWVDPGNWPRIWKLGGVAWPGHSDADSYVKEWEQYRPGSTPFEFGWGYGADLGGLSHQPEAPQDGRKIAYPFKSYDGRVTFDRQKTGERTFDYNSDGVAHYGLYPEWFEDLRIRGGRQMADDMWNGAEAYLQMWERAAGVPGPKCASPTGSLSSRGRGAIRLGAKWETLLQRAGQPQGRSRTWTWCVKGKRNRRAADVAVLSRAGRVELVGTTVRGRSAGGVRVGARASALRGTRPAGSGLRIRRAGSRTWVYAVSGGRVSAAAVTTASSRAALRSAMRRVRSAKASNALPRYRPNKAETASGGKLTGKPLAGTTNPRVNAALAYLCSLQLQA